MGFLLTSMFVQELLAVFKSWQPRIFVTYKVQTFILKCDMCFQSNFICQKVIDWSICQWLQTRSPKGFSCDSSEEMRAGLEKKKKACWRNRIQRDQARGEIVDGAKRFNLEPQLQQLSLNKLRQPWRRTISRSGWWSMALPPLSYNQFWSIKNI